METDIHWLFDLFGSFFEEFICLVLNCSVAGLVLIGGLRVSTHVLGHLIDILDASASVWPVLVDEGLDLTLLSELFSSEVKGS